MRVYLSPARIIDPDAISTLTGPICDMRTTTTPAPHKSASTSRPSNAARRCQAMTKAAGATVALAMLATLTVPFIPGRRRSASGQRRQVVERLAASKMRLTACWSRTSG
ncbi:hypothetical protein J4G33_15365 [Actinotalea sp. BY-33]|uniref:Uncharacterized protein n=1 Tax=Actinotalea soli TaxID=2819234 RepID=A0A939LUF5_9CELL|nr:hypothetical protein [Actinotalea soli]MBO1753185.1 hypothetical protein [Actinotalea soli]